MVLCYISAYSYHFPGLSRLIHLIQPLVRSRVLLRQSIASPLFRSAVCSNSLFPAFTLPPEICPSCSPETSSCRHSRDRLRLPNSCSSNISCQRQPPFGYNFASSVPGKTWNVSRAKPTYSPVSRTHLVVMRVRSSPTHRNGYQLTETDCELTW